MPITFGNIAGEESATVTFRVATVAIGRGSTTEQQEILVLGDPQSSLGLARVLAAPPASTEYGLGVRIISGPSSAGDLVFRPAFSSTSADNPVRAVWSSTLSDNRAIVYQSTAGDLVMRPVFSSTSTDNPVQISGNSTAMQGTNPWVVGGDTAAGAADSGNPVKIGGKAASGAPTSVANAQRVNALWDLDGRLMTRHGSQSHADVIFTATSVAAERSKASVTKVSAGGTKRNVVTGFTVTLATGSVAPTAAAPITCSLINGAAGGSTYLWQDVFPVPAVAGVKLTVTKANVWFPGSTGSAVTLEFASSGAANTFQSVCFDGTVIADT